MLSTVFNVHFYGNIMSLKKLQFLTIGIGTETGKELDNFLYYKYIWYFGLSSTHWHLHVKYKLALAKSICQQLNNDHKGVCPLPLWRLNPMLLKLPTFSTPWGEFRGEKEALRAPGKLVEQVFRWLDLFRVRFHDPDPCAVLSHFRHVWLFGTPWTAARQAPLPMGFFRQEYWVGCHFLLQGIFPTQSSNWLLCLLQWQVGSLPLTPPRVPPGKPISSSRKALNPLMIKSAPCN